MLHKQDAQNASHAATSSRTGDADGKERNLTSKVVTIYTMYIYTSSVYNALQIHIYSCPAASVQ